MEDTLNYDERIIAAEVYSDVLEHFSYKLEGVSEKEIYDACVGISRNHDITDEQVFAIADQVKKEVMNSKAFIDKLQNESADSEDEPQAEEEQNENQKKL